MQKDLFISQLKEKAGVDNLSDRTIDEVATLFLPQFADDAQITNESWTMPVQMAKVMSGQLRHDLSVGINDYKTKFESDTKDAQAKAIADAVAAATEEWEKNNGSDNGGGNDGNVEPPKTEQPDIDKKIAEAMANAMAALTGEEGALGKLNKQVSDFLTYQAEKERQQTEASVRDQIKDYLIGRGVEEDDYALEICLEKLEIGEKPDVPALKAKAEKSYEAIYKRMHKGDGAQPFSGGGCGGGTDTNTEFKNFIKSRQAAAEQEAKDAEELKKYMM